MIIHEQNRYLCGYKFMFQLNSELTAPNAMQSCTTKIQLCGYLVDWMAKFIIVVIECCLQLSFASSCEDPDDLIVTVLFMMDLLMKYFGL
jgi:hypothetical protein